MLFNWSCNHKYLCTSGISADYCTTVIFYRFCNENLVNNQMLTIWVHGLIPVYYLS